MTEPHQNLLAGSGGPSPTLLSEDPAAADLAENAGMTQAQLVELTARHPASSLCWATLAERALAVDTAESNVTAYAYARVGYHRGLDALRRSGWRGTGPVPWEHLPNRGFLTALWALSVAARRIGEIDEVERCSQFLRDCSETAYQQLTRFGPVR